MLFIIKILKDIYQEKFIMQLKILATSVFLAGCELTSSEETITRVATVLQNQINSEETKVCEFDYAPYVLGGKVNIVLETSTRVIRIIVQAGFDVRQDQSYEIMNGILTHAILGPNVSTLISTEPVLHAGEGAQLNLFVNKVAKILARAEQECV